MLIAKRSLEGFSSTRDRAVQLRAEADVPLGLFLSGGLDSSAIGYYMRQHSSDVRSFSIAFHEEAYDESRFAQLAAAHLGTRHHVEYLTSDQMLELVERIPEILDEPMGDSSIFPTFLLSEFTRRHVTVALGGDGSDELLMGYRAFDMFRGLWKYDRVPRPLRALASGLARTVLGPQRTPWTRSRWLVRQGDVEPEHRQLSYLGAFRGDSSWILAPEIRAGYDQRPLLDRVEGFPSFAGPRSAANRTVAAYAQGYLLEDILVKVDRASMAASLEARSPFLDPDLVDLIGRMPEELKLRGRTRKYILRRLMRGRLPDETIDRPKQGFGIPLGEWLRGALAPLVEEYLDADRIRANGLLDADRVRRIVDGHRERRGDYGNALWVMLQFELWQRSAGSVRQRGWVHLPSGPQPLWTGEPLVASGARFAIRVETVAASSRAKAAAQRPMIIQLNIAIGELLTQVAPTSIEIANATTKAIAPAPSAACGPPRCRSTAPIATNEARANSSASRPTTPLSTIRPRYSECTD